MIHIPDTQALLSGLLSSSELLTEGLFLSHNIVFRCWSAGVHREFNKHIHNVALKVGFVAVHRANTVCLRQGQLEGRALT